MDPYAICNVGFMSVLLNVGHLQEKLGRRVIDEHGQNLKRYSLLAVISSITDSLLVYHSKRPFWNTNRDLVHFSISLAIIFKNLLLASSTLFKPFTLYSLYYWYIVAWLQYWPLQLCCSSEVTLYHCQCFLFLLNRPTGNELMSLWRFVEPSKYKSKNPKFKNWHLIPDLCCELPEIHACITAEYLLLLSAVFVWKMSCHTSTSTHT